MSVSIANHYNSVPINYEGTIKSDGKGGQYFDRELLQKQGENLPSFVGKVYTEEELYQYVDDKVRQNQSNKKTLEDMIKDSCIGWGSATFKFVGESKTYTYYDFIQEMEKRSENSRVKDKVMPQSEQAAKGTHTLVMGGLCSRGLIDGGCVTVYKAAEYSAENLIMRVVTKTADGQEREEFIDPTKVNPASATENEMSALTAYLVDEKKLDSASALGVGAGDAKWNANASNVSTEKKNFYALAEEMMQMQYACHNFAGYTAYKKILSAYDVFMNKN